MKKLMFTLACAASAAVMAKLQTTADFEKFTAGTMAEDLAATDDANTGDNGSKFWAFKDESSENDASVVTAHGTAPLPNGVDGESNYLKLETNGDELQRKVNADGAAATVGNGLYIDTLVQFTATPDSSSVSIDAGAKLAIWLEGEGTEESPYALKVKGCSYDYNSEKDAENLLCEQCTYTLSTDSIAPETWYRLTVKAVSTDMLIGSYPAFQISLDGKVLTTVENSYTAGTVALFELFEGSEDATTAAKATSILAMLESKKFVPSMDMTHAAAQLTSVGFQGSGAIDNVTITDEDPTVVTPTSVEFTITLGENVSSVTYTISDVEGETTLTAEDTFSVNIDAKVTVTAATAADWYKVAIPAAVTASAENNSIAVTATEVAVDENTTATSLGITTGGFANADATALAPVVTWAKANNISVSDINAMAFTPGALTYNEKGYLFNMDPADTDAIDDEEEGFKVTAISYNAETGKWEVEDNGKDGWNGKVEIRGAQSLTNPTWSKENEAGPFFKAFLTK